jgi:hypothetical protein
MVIFSAIFVSFVLAFMFKTALRINSYSNRIVRLEQDIDISPPP